MQPAHCQPVNAGLTRAFWNWRVNPPSVRRWARCAIGLVLRAYLRVYHRLEIVGAERLAICGSFVIVSNHASHLDTLCLLAALPLARLPQAFAAAATDYFFTSVPRVLVAVLAVNALPFDRNHHVRQSMMRCRELLRRRGNILVLYPEGTRSVDGRVGAFKPGIGKLLGGTDVAVVPCWIEGARKAWPKGAWLPRPRRVRVIVGEARTYCDSARAICDDLRGAVLKLKEKCHDDADA
jgi:1-acyl-sn-glycerol-3-phosphate acyltransferase